MNLFTLGCFSVSALMAQSAVGWKTNNGVKKVKSKQQIVITKEQRREEQAQSNQNEIYLVSFELTLCSLLPDFDH